MEGVSATNPFRQTLPPAAPKRRVAFEGLMRAM